jgi:hypothetical protein
MQYAGCMQAVCKQYAGSMQAVDEQLTCSTGSSLGASLTYAPMCCSSTQEDLPYHFRIDRPCAALFKMVRYVLLRPLRPELDAKTKTSLPAKTRFCHLDEQATCVPSMQSPIQELYRLNAA